MMYNGWGIYGKLSYCVTRICSRNAGLGSTLSGLACSKQKCKNVGVGN